MVQNDNQDIDLSGRVALVTGAWRGLGRGFAQALASAGATVAVTARTESQLDETVSLIEGDGGQAAGFPVDVADQKAMGRVVETIEARLGPIDVLVNNAGVIAPTGNDWEIDPDEWWYAMEINLRGPFTCTTVLLPSMIARRRGRIVSISSAGAYRVHPYATSYCAAKAALSHYTRCLAPAVKEHGISIFAYAPGYVRTSLTEHLATSPEMPEAAKKRFQNNFDEGRDDSMEDAVRMLMFLASGKADALSGRHISIDDSEEQLTSGVERILAEDLHTLQLQR